MKENYENLKKGQINPELLDALTPEILEEALKLTKNKILTKHNKSVVEKEEDDRIKNQPIINGLGIIIKKDEAPLEVIEYGIRKRQIIEVNDINYFDDIQQIILNLKWNITNKNIKDYYINIQRIKNISSYISEESGNYVRPLNIKTQNYNGFLTTDLLVLINQIIMKRKEHKINYDNDKINYELYIKEVEKLQTRLNITTNPYYMEQKNKK